jgi:antitoxin ParD1/3/4
MKAAARNISFTARHYRLIDRKLAAGDHQTASDVVREAMQLLEDRDAIARRWHEQIELGWADSEAGRVVDGPTAMARMRKTIRATAQKRA